MVIYNPSIEKAGLVRTGDFVTPQDIPSNSKINQLHYNNETHKSL